MGREEAKEPGGQFTVTRNNRPTAATSSQLPFWSLLPSWLALAWLVSKAQWFWTHRPDLEFGWIVLLLVLYLIWESWGNRPPVLLRWTVPGAGAVAIAAGMLFLVQIYQAANGTNAASLAALAMAALLLIAGNLTYVFGARGIRHFGFGFGFLLVAMPLPSIVSNLVVGGLQSQIAFLNVEILNLLGVPASRVGSLIRLPNCTVGVDEACSGIRSLQSTLMATLFIGYLSLSWLALRVWLVMAGVVLAIFGNVMRSLYLSFTANSKGLAALEAAHDSAGWWILLFTAAGVALVAWFFSRLERRNQRKPLGHDPAADASHLRP